MTLHVRPVDVNHIQHFWPAVEPFIAEALAKGGDFPDWADGYNIHHVRGYVSSGQWLLLVAVDEESKIHGAMTVSFINYPLHRVAFVTTAGGKSIANSELLAQLKALVKHHGATKIQAFCRESMVRLLSRAGFEPRNVLVETQV
jgi:hypothetical protein